MRKVIRKTYSYRYYEVGDKRIRKGFLFFPKTIANERRWLETAEWEEELVPHKKKASLSAGGWSYWINEWVSTKWTN